MHILWADRWHGSEVQILLRLARVELCLEQRPGLSQAFTKVQLFGIEPTGSLVGVQKIRCPDEWIFHLLRLAH
jgi:hypothetical protein